RNHALLCFPATHIDSLHRQRRYAVKLICRRTDVPVDAVIRGRRGLVLNRTPLRATPNGSFKAFVYVQGSGRLQMRTEKFGCDIRSPDRKAGGAGKDLKAARIIENGWCMALVPSRQRFELPGRYATDRSDREEH